MEVARFKDIKLGKAEVLFQSDDNLSLIHIYQL